jgi:hypothetical protein
VARMTGTINVAAAANTLLSHRRRALILALEHLLGVSRQLVPHEEGTLERSGRVVLIDDNRGAVTYDTPYAVRQHEELDYRHDAGRQAKYLEQPMTTERAVILAIIAAELRRGTS